MQRAIGVGGFYLPTVYRQDKEQVTALLEQGVIDYADLSKWSFSDEFLCYVMESKLLQFVDRTYPNPRTKNEVPIWFLITCQFIMRLYQTGRYNNLRYLLNAGSILTQFGFNVGSTKIGFNNKNKKVLNTAVDADSVRKFFKDTNSIDIRSWYCNDLQNWFRQQHTYDHHGVFILDQTHLVVPDNPNSKLGLLTVEQKKSLVYHRCYALSTLLNVGVERELFHIAAYELGAGDADELTQAEKIVPFFAANFLVS